MEFFRFGKYTFLLLILIFIAASCGSLTEDIAPNPAVNKYYRMEFDITNTNGVVRKELGIANIFLTEEDSNYEKVFITITGIYKGTLNVFSNACGVNFNRNFEGRTKFKLSDLVPNPTKCALKLTATTDPIKNREHNIVESGLIKINVLPKDNTPLRLEYIRTNSVIKREFQNYSYLGQGSMQRSAGALTSNEEFTVRSKLEDGGIYRVTGCGFDTEGSFDTESFVVKLKDLYKKNDLKSEDSCDFEVIVIPNSAPFSHKARFSINIYNNKILKLEPLTWEIKKTILGKRLIVEGRKYVIICGINDEYEYKKKEKKEIKCKEKYKSGKTYWIRAVTANGRKNIFAVRDGQVTWKE
ncbi:hypothetical protein N9948_00460 [bacterium]|nr:hypothetical protein [bacterium]